MEDSRHRIRHNIPTLIAVCMLGNILTILILRQKRFRGEAVTRLFRRGRCEECMLIDEYDDYYRGFLNFAQAYQLEMYSKN